MFRFNILTITNSVQRYQMLADFPMPFHSLRSCLILLLYKATAKRMQFSHSDSNRLFNKTSKQIHTNTDFTIQLLAFCFVNFEYLILFSFGVFGICQSRYYNNCCCAYFVVIFICWLFHSVSALGVCGM